MLFFGVYENVTNHLFPLFQKAFWASYQQTYHGNALKILLILLKFCVLCFHAKLKPKLNRVKDSQHIVPEKRRPCLGSDVLAYPWSLVLLYAFHRFTLLQSHLKSPGGRSKTDIGDSVGWVTIGA